MSGGDRMSDDMVPALVRTISQRESVAAKSRQAGSSPEEEVEMLNGWGISDPSTGTVTCNS
jgi:hypothetical protein